ncbi:MAG TPA: long-chain fatty acid--CoA ligase [Streptosporangiaceae bacterium]|jgi:fatty-acyl-CoA synthase
MRSTMMDYPLTVTALMSHGLNWHGDATVSTFTGDGTRVADFRTIARRVARLAGALRRLGVTADQRVATFQWNNQEHLEAYLAVPSMGAVLHTLNIRLFPDQLVYVANHAEDDVVIVDASLVSALAAVLPRFTTVRHVLVAGGPGTDTSPLEGAGPEIHAYEDLLAAEPDSFDWPEDLDERSAAAMCYSSGTTGNPKGVVYSHRSVYLHSMSACMGDRMALSGTDRVLPIVPMFHANAWGMPYAAVMAGAGLAMPDRYLQAEPLARLIADQRPTVAGAVPTIWIDLLNHIRENGTDISSLRMILAGGSAVPLSLMQALERESGVPIVQAWGMTETSPLASIARPPAGIAGEAGWRYRATQGRLVSGVDGRLSGEGDALLPADGASVGEIEVRGPWVTAAYYRENADEKFHDGWLRTGDVGTIDDDGYITLTDRAKDVIKSGGEWISSVDLENALMGHPDVIEAAVVGVPDEKWQERPLATVVLRTDATATPEGLRDYLAARMARWQLPERWSVIPEVPKTSVGKFDKKRIRKAYAEGDLDVKRVD